MGKTLYNVSVRLDDKDYKELLFLHDKFNKESRGKVSLADVLRISINETYDRELDKEKAIQEVKKKESNPVKTVTPNKVTTPVQETVNKVKESAKTAQKAVEAVKPVSNTKTPKAEDKAVTKESEASKQDVKKEDGESISIEQLLEEYKQELAKDKGLTAAQRKSKLNARKKELEEAVKAEPKTATK
ncbi:hypothetical protein ABEX38_29985 [Priestia megaterium]